MCDTGVSLLVRAVWYEKLIMYLNRILYDISGLFITFFIYTIIFILFIYFTEKYLLLKNNENTK